VVTAETGIVASARLEVVTQKAVVIRKSRCADSTTREPNELIEVRSSKRVQHSVHRIGRAKVE